jgi:hypothetical protein
MFASPTSYLSKVFLVEKKETTYTQRERERERERAGKRKKKNDPLEKSTYY